jgi:hypothetical protein
MNITSEVRNELRRIIRINANIRRGKISHNLFIDGHFSSSLLDATLKVTYQLRGFCLTN